MTIDITSFAEAQEKLETLCDLVCESHEPAIIPRRGGHHVVLMALEDYQRLTGKEEPSAAHLDSLYLDLEREEDA
jgi:PHD/YefM family antitoxin component YafN of YafNO toxin-antitoxin module